MFDWNFAAKHWSPQRIIPATLKTHLPSLVLSRLMLSSGGGPANRGEGCRRKLSWRQNCGSLGVWVIYIRPIQRFFMGVTSLNLHWLLTKLHAQGGPSSVKAGELLSHRKSTGHSTGWGRWSSSASEGQWPSPAEKELFLLSYWLKVAGPPFLIMRWNLSEDRVPPSFLSVASVGPLLHQFKLMVKSSINCLHPINPRAIWWKCNKSDNSSRAAHVTISGEVRKKQNKNCTFPLCAFY